MDMLDDDVEMERWMALTDEQQDAEVERAMAEYFAWLDRMSLAEQYANHRRSAVERQRKWRRLIRDHGLGDWATEHVTHTQIYMVKLRAWRSTGIWPGSG